MRQTGRMHNALIAVVCPSVCLSRAWPQVNGRRRERKDVRKPKIRRKPITWVTRDPI